MKYKATIGMEVHCELKTQSKMFCSCVNDLSLEKKPNINICPVCTGQPGALPTPNKQAIAFVQKVGAALKCRINKISKFDRKNYFYPDLPKGYQISQYDEPLVEDGFLEVGDRNIGITRVHMEEDTGKSQHSKVSGDTLVDLNRSSVPLMELVTEPDVTSGKEAGDFCRKLQQILRYLEVSDADMEKGQMRCEANISLYKEGEDRLSGTKVEVKNLNSFKSVERAIAYEIERQSKLLDKGEKIVQETRGWDEGGQKTVSQRKKESAHDYRYFPEPDIPPMEFDDEYIKDIYLSLPELPDEKKRRFMEQFGITLDQAKILTSDVSLAHFFENVLSEIDEKKVSKEFAGDIQKAQKTASNYLIVELRKKMFDNNTSFEDLLITPENFAEFSCIVADGKINSSTAQTVLQEMYETGEDPSRIIDEKNLAQMSDTGELESIVEGILKENHQSVTDYKAGKDKALGFLVGQVMKETKGKANPQVVNDMLNKKLSL
jgi:aspartyl-tRNA(Asn)/glutamyl-tRNA(Gln) amidotransferase subunit B